MVSAVAALSVRAHTPPAHSLGSPALLHSLHSCLHSFGGARSEGAPAPQARRGTMQTFFCSCHNRLFFDNSRCLECGRQVGFSAAHRQLVALDAEGDPHRPCRHYGAGTCNWLLAAGEAGDLCLACRLNVEVAADGEPELVANVEKAKRRLVFGLLRLGLPVVPRNEHPAGVGFALRRGAPDAPVITGHADGLITLDLNEADPAQRIATRKALGEDYRTLLGHFRHESGHYYWTLLFASDALLTGFRELFGDERTDYAAALEAHYAAPRTDYQNTHISSYATAHAWEDWAETWAHYLHILDSWETAVAFGLRAGPRHPLAEGTDRFTAFLDDWSELMIALNSMNRSMGHDDAYPFVLPPLVREKLSYVDRTVRENLPRLNARFQTPSDDREAPEDQTRERAASPQTTALPEPQNASQ